MANEKSVKNEKIAELFKNSQELSTLYDLEKNLDSGVEKIILKDKGYEKLAEFFYNQENIDAYKITAYYIERFNDIKKEYKERVLKNGVITEKTHTYYKPISSKYIEFNTFKTLLDM